MVYVLMSENTQSVGFVWPIWRSSSAGIFRLTASAPELACSGYRLTDSCGLVDDVAAAGRPREFGNGGAAGGARGVGGSGATGETGGREARVEPYRRAESRAHTLAAGGGGSGVRPGFRDVNPVGAGPPGPAVAVVSGSGGWLLDAPAAHASLREGLSA